ncbi:MAG: cupin domain-containing protein [Gammaproteobacteria bacterium]|nr:cupin domain-containing protein [Gammaproteobacteria bacterium]
MKTPPSLPLPLLGGLTATDFLADYWQKRPLLIRNAVPGFICPVTPDELAGLACEAEVESRLILERDGPSPWWVEHGPLAEERFAQLPETHWTLLIQECQKYLPELVQLMEQFDFIPSWRVDDVMASHAPPGGSVGPHLDQYDVFLLQAHGHRRWQISDKKVAPDNFLPDLDLRIMREFEATDEWVLEPGDMLYLPPGLAHYGVALDDCITLSVGFRAPGHGELLGRFVDHVLTGHDPSQRYSDPELTPSKNPGEISPAARQQCRDIIRMLMCEALDDNSTDGFDSWFGQFITETKNEDTVEAPEHTLESAQLVQLFQDHQTLHRSEYARFAYIAREDGVDLFIDGRCFSLSSDLAFAAPLLCNQHHYPFSRFSEKLKAGPDHTAFAHLLTELYNCGYVVTATP